MNDISKGDGVLGTGRRSIHPGSGRRKAAPFPRGRVLREEEVAAVRAILGDRPRERALLIEYLHLIQDHAGFLPEGHLQALAEELKIPMAEVYEVATFYAHFDVVRAGDPGLPVGKLQSRLSIPGSTLSHHLKTLIIVGLVSQEREATTLICHANYPVMRGLVEFLVAECCTEADCATIRQQADTAA